MGTSTAFLSIDWDFFVRCLGEWDWSHKETPFFMGSEMWTIRLAPYLSQNMDLMAEMEPDKWARPKPSDFWSVLKGLGYDFDYLDTFVVAESHSAAAPLFYENVTWTGGTPDYIINFDAHHDLGYCEWKRLNEMIEEGTCTCDMWLCALLEWLPGVKVRVVYPDWLREETSIKRQRKHIEERLPQYMLDKVELGFFENKDGSVGDVVRKPGETIEVTTLMICRSGAWTPPWLDEQFVDFVRGAEHEFVVEAQEFQEDDPVLSPRNFSFKEAEKLGKQWRDMMKPRS